MKISKEETIFCEQKLSDKCLAQTFGRFTRSIERPISGFFNKNDETSDKTTIACEQGLVIKISKSEVSNVDKTKCSTTQVEGKTEDCTDKLLTTILLTKK